VNNLVLVFKSCETVRETNQRICGPYEGDGAKSNSNDQGVYNRIQKLHGNFHPATFSLEQNHPLHRISLTFRSLTNQSSTAHFNLFTHFAPNDGQATSTVFLLLNTKQYTTQCSVLDLTLSQPLHSFNSKAVIGM
jgi:hypothetical protein